MDDMYYKYKCELFYRYIRLLQEGVTLEKICLSKGLNEVAIYGFDMIGKCLLYEFKNSKIKVKYIIDQKGKDIGIDFPVYKLCEKRISDIDGVIISPVDEYTKIEKEIRTVLPSVKVVTVEDLLYEI